MKHIVLQPHHIHTGKMGSIPVICLCFINNIVKIHYLCSNKCCNIHRVSWCRSGMRSSSMECTTTHPRRASLVSCQLPTPHTPSDTLVLKGLPFICQQKACQSVFAATVPLMVANLFPFFHPTPHPSPPSRQNHKCLAMQAQSSCIAFWP